MKRTPEYNTILQMCRKNYDQMMQFLRFAVQRMGEQKEGRMNGKVTYRGGYPT